MNQDDEPSCQDVDYLDEEAQAVLRLVSLVKNKNKNVRGKDMVKKTLLDNSLEQGCSAVIVRNLTVESVVPHQLDSCCGCVVGLLRRF